MTVSDLDRSVRFFVDVLGFEAKAAHRAGGPTVRAAARRVRGANARGATDAGPRGPRAHGVRGAARPAVSRGHARQRPLVPAHRDHHVATWRPPTRACARTTCRTPPPVRSGCRTGIPAPAASRPTTSAIPTATSSKSCSFPRARAIRGGTRRTRSSSASTTPPSSSTTRRSRSRSTATAWALRVAGQGENYGEEQEHLNNVFGARLRITTLRAPTGPGVELLQYLAPRDGRPCAARPQGQRPGALADHHRRAGSRGAAHRAARRGARVAGRRDGGHRDARLLARPHAARSRRACDAPGGALSARKHSRGTRILGPCS